MVDSFRAHQFSALVPLFTVGPALARDMYGLTCRLVNPVTGETMHEDVNIVRVR
jgi:hypothetical protein